MKTDVHDAAGASTAATKKNRTREVRFALVLNGGVSLAVWMGGVTHELNRLRLASEEEGSDSVWRKILDAAGRTATIDLVAGTSAGGLNGAVLATTIARGGDMPNMRDRWSDLASLDVGKLTNSNPDGARSVLDGAYLEKGVDDVLAGIGQRADRARECTLFTTATALDTRAPLELADGRTVITADGRRVYKFVHRNATNDVEEINHFAPGDGDDDALTTAARATAAFPVAFEPVLETGQLRDRRDPPAPNEQLATLVDGGVLDNAPFEPLLRALRERPIDEPFERVLLYVTPGVSTDPANQGPQPQRSLESVLGSVLSATREPDERLDVDALKQSFELMGVTSAQPHQVIQRHLRGTNRLAPSDLAKVAEQVLPLYLAGRAEWLQRRLERSSTASPLQPPGPVKLHEKDIPGGTPGSVEVGGDWRWGALTADRVLRWWGRALSDIDDSRYKVALEAVGRAQRKVTDIRKELAGAIDTPSVEPKVAGSADDPRLSKLTELYDTNRNDLYRKMDEAATAIAAAGPLTVADLFAVSLSTEVLGFVLNWGGSEYDPPRFRYENLTPTIDPPAILESPATRSAAWPGMKLYGERWRHFGAFATPTGREHDWLWGRIDGATALARELLAHSDIERPEAEVLCDNLVREILREENRTPEEVLSDAARMTKLSGTALLGLLLQNDTGEKTLEHLEQTVWALTPQFESLGTYDKILRAALARDDWSSGTKRFSREGAKLIAIRVWAKPLRAYLNRKLNHLADSARAEARQLGFG